MKFSIAHSCRLSAYCFSYREISWTLSIHGFLSSDEWCIWLVKGQRKRRMAIKHEKHLFMKIDSGLWGEGCLLNSPPSSSSSFFCLFFILVHKRAATASDTCLSSWKEWLHCKEWMICECWLASLLDYAWMTTSVFCLVLFPVVVNHGSSISNHCSSSATTCFWQYESKGHFQTDKEEPFIFRNQNYSWYRIFPVYTSVAYLTVWRLSICLIYPFLFCTLYWLLTSRDAFTGKRWLAVGEWYWLLTRFALSLMAQRQPFK